jgi:hypothetical protein
VNIGFFNILCYHNEMSQNIGYCPGYFKIVHLSGKVRSSLLLAELYNSSVTDADICGVGMCVLYSQIYQDLVLVGTSEFLSQSRFPSLCLAEGFDGRSVKWMFMSSSMRLLATLLQSFFYGTRFCEQFAALSIYLWINNIIN